ncbi:MAG: hypothetical protein IT392_12170 [Nitrospirae bacterium]|nr:hypothetical protein [Nitrospirota bacterium]
MKSIIIVLFVLILVTAGAGYFGIPILIRNETAVIKADLQDMKQRFDKIEEFVKNDEEAMKMTQFPPDAEAGKIIKTVNSNAVKIASLEKSLSATKELINKQNGAFDKAISQQKQAIDDSTRKQSEALDSVRKETKGNLQRIEFSASLANFRSHLLRVYVELRSNNIASARGEMDFLNNMLEEARTAAANGDKKAIEQFQATLKKARTEVETDLPATINIINSLWHDMGKLLRKS